MEVDIIDRLTGHKTLGAAPREELAWLAGHASVRHMGPGDVLTAKGAQVAGLYVILAGRLSISVDRGAGMRKIMEWRGGDVTGLLPYSRLVSPPGDVVAHEATEILAVPRDCLRALTRECYEITAILVHSMLDRARLFTSSELQDEKMASLGKLSAGLAHELINPASAIERSAVLLRKGLVDSEQSARELGAARLTGSQLAVVDGLRESCAVTSVRGVLSPIEEAERAEAMTDWLDDRRLDTDMAEQLADTPATFEALDLVAGAVDASVLNAALRWAAAGCAVRRLASEIQDAATRISGLVAAIKGFTHMDQAAVAEPVSLIQSLGDTVTVLKSKARAKSVRVNVEIEPGLPRVHGFAGELNQIWLNLIDNAIDVVSDSGRVEVSAKREGRRVIVAVVDNGSGIPAQIRERIFEPFFTTKPMGQGTGLGLDITRRLVRHNDGEISVESQPGQTQFRVSLPMAEIDDTPGGS